jgi:hypothetical protein
MMNRFRCAALLAFGMAFAAAGCGQSGPKMTEVSGTVKYDGQDVAEGDIAFLPEDKSVGGEGGKIKNGRYTLKVKEGKNKVQIFASRAVPGKKGPMGEDLVEQYIPEKYNDKTDLAADVGSGKTEHNFDLKK